MGCYANIERDETPFFNGIPSPVGTEVRNRGLEQYLRAFTADKPTNWANFLPWAELALNCFHNASLGTSPFRALYGRQPPALIAAQPSATTPPKVADLIVQRGALLVELRRNLERAQQRMAEAANRHRRDVSYEVGDKVLLKLQQYRQHSVAKQLSNKLGRRFFGPFEVTEKIGPVAYRLKLLEGSRIHDVFHVSLLRPFVEGAKVPAEIAFPEEFVGSRPVMRPVKIWERRTVMRKGEPREEALVQWPVDGEKSCTWEPLEEVVSRFPFLLEDKEPLIGEGVDTTMGIQGKARVESDTGIEVQEKAGAGTDLEGEVQQNVQQKVKGKGKQRGRMAERSPRPRRQARTPARYRDFVSY